MRLNSPLRREKADEDKANHGGEHNDRYRFQNAVAEQRRQ